MLRALLPASLIAAVLLAAAPAVAQDKNFSASFIC